MLPRVKVLSEPIWGRAFLFLFCRVQDQVKMKMRQLLCMMNDKWQCFKFPSPFNSFFASYSFSIFSFFFFFSFFFLFFFFLFLFLSFSFSFFFFFFLFLFLSFLLFLLLHSNVCEMGRKKERKKTKQGKKD